MTLTDYHAKYLAYELTRRHSSDDLDKLTGAVASAQVDLNPHQVDAALFAFRSPFSQGALLADEVGLGKTIEAGLVISQRWAERKRRILVITPANLRKQWLQELTEKFALPCVILETRSYNEAAKKGAPYPFDTEGASVVICSYGFAKNKKEEVRRGPWDLVVVDEAHRLRNVYKPGNVTAQALQYAIGRFPKILLTATPLQNSLLEMFGLVSFIDPHVFGDLRSFREQFANPSDNNGFQVLRERLRPICHRTLRRQVSAYVPYTKRLPMLEEFMPEDSETELYDRVSAYLQRESLEALPSGQRTLITLVLRKLLASSSFAIAGALTTLLNRLNERLGRSQTEKVVGGGGKDVSLDVEEFAADYEALNVTEEEWDAADAEPLPEGSRAALLAEIAELEEIVALAVSIESNGKGISLLKALRAAFAKAKELGAAEKAILFTESRRTQDYLVRVLQDSPYGDGIVLFNGSNSDERSKQIYNAWSERHRGTDRVTGSRTADMRSALVDYFRDEGRIMIATEAGAEGINLQFCSLVVNYDLPWNPQRIEQRIGRCHRYGQKHDVVVVNFVNRQNEADKRVYELLEQKFKLFDGVFGASDEVLGALESGVDFEKRIAAIYQECRHPEEIKSAFDALQRELSGEINEAMTKTRQKLLEHFDDEVRDKLRMRKQEAEASLGRLETQLMQVTRHELGEDGEFGEDGSFWLRTVPSFVSGAAVPTGLYELPRRSPDAHIFRLNHPLAEAVLKRARERDLPVAEVRFDYSGYDGKISTLAPFVGESGWLTVAQFSVSALDQAEDHMLCAAVSDTGVALDEDAVRRLIGAAGGEVVGTIKVVPGAAREALDGMVRTQQATISRAITERNADFFEKEVEKLDGWAEDLKTALERDIKEWDRQIKEARRAATAAGTLEQKLAGQKLIKELESKRNTARKTLFTAQDEVDSQREGLIGKIEGRLMQNSELLSLFTIRWILQ